MRKYTAILPKIPIRLIINNSIPNKLNAINIESRLVLRNTIGEKLI